MPAPPPFDPPRDGNGRPDLRGLSFAFFGTFAYWPAYHPGTPRQVVTAAGGTVRAKVTDALDYVVLGDKRGTGRSEARKKAESLARKAAKADRPEGSLPRTVQILDEAAFRAGVRQDITGKRFCFAGGFDCSPAGFADDLLTRMTEAAGAVVEPKMSDQVDYLVLGNRRGKGKTAILRRAEQLRAAGHPLALLNEAGFLELVRTDQSVADSGDGFASFMARLYACVDDKKLQRAMKMLKSGRNQLFVDVDDDHLKGVVRSQTGVGSIYASWLRHDGSYGCATPELDPCMGLQGSVCKHLLVLLVGLVRLEAIDAGRATAWIDAAARNAPTMDEPLASDALLRYAGAEAGEIDWRPMETLPEDFFAL